LKPPALLRFAAPHFTFAVLGQLDQENSVKKVASWNGKTGDFL
jgi:hypothetical protein